MSLSSKWFKGIHDPQEREDLEQTVRNGTYLLGKVAQMIQDTLDELEVTKVADYDKAGWPYYRADRDGQIRALKSLLDHITAR